MLQTVTPAGGAWRDEKTRAGMKATLFAHLLRAAPLAARTPGAETRVKAALQRIERPEPQVNAIIALVPDAVAQARALDRGRRARGPLHGLPLLVKDNVAESGLPPAPLVPTLER